MRKIETGRDKRERERDLKRGGEVEDGMGVSSFLAVKVINTLLPRMW